MKRRIALLVLAAAVPASAHSTGAPSRVTGAPGDDSAACTQCHSLPLNPQGGKVEILLPGAAAYTPGVKQHITVRVTDSAQKRWGFELTARLNSNLTNGQAGDLVATDANTQAYCDNDLPKPCSSRSPVQFITHTLAGTRNGTPGGASFEFDWTPPDSDAGPVTLYAAGNAANGNGAPTGDHIYTTSVVLTVAPAQTSGPKPTIQSNGVVNAASFQTTVAPNSWITIFGSNLASSTRLWAASDIPNGNLPTSLDGTSVMVNGKPGYVEFISPGQLNVLAPDDPGSGPVTVQITTPNGVSESFTAQLQPVSPGFFLFDGKYLAATHADSSLLGKPGLFASAPGLTTPAKPGEVVILYGTGFGTTNPGVPFGKVVTQLAPLVTTPQITIGGVAAKVQFAGLIPGFAGLYQFNVEIPGTLSDGDQKVVALLSSSASPASDSCCFLTIQH